MSKKAQGKAVFEGMTERLKDADLNTFFIFAAILLVLIVGVYALFSPDAQNARLGNPACGNIVIATDGPSLAANVSASLSEARFFLVVNPLSKKLLESIRNPYRGPQPNPQIAYLIAGKGEEAVIVGDIDQQSYNILMQFGIRVFGGYQGQARKSISLYRQARIGQSPQPTDTVTQVPVTPQGAQQANVPQTAAQQAGWGMNQPYCPVPARMQANGMQGNGMQGGRVGAGFGMTDIPNMGMAYPLCPVPNGMQMNTMQGGMGAGFGMPDMNGMGMAQPVCPFPGAGLQANAMQGGTPAGFGMTDMTGMGVQDIYNKGVMDAMNMNNPGDLGTQVAFGWGQQPFVCPNCNWRINALRQGNNFPNCPNCRSPMALDMSSKNPIGKWWANNGQQAANMTQLRPQMNQMTNQPNFWQGPESTGFFLCPNCNWRMYSQQGANEFPKCPNCGQIMARGGAYSVNPNTWNNSAPAVLGGNGNSMNPGAMNQVAFAQNNTNYYNPANPPTTAIIPANTGAVAPVALQQAQTGQPLAPPIFRDAVMPHEYRGVCENCHVIRSDIPIQANALMPHPYRGVCSNCHQILGTPAGAQDPQQTTQYVPNNTATDPMATRVAIAGGQ